MLYYFTKISTQTVDGTGKSATSSGHVYIIIKSKVLQKVLLKTAKALWPRGQSFFFFLHRPNWIDAQSKSLMHWWKKGYSIRLCILLFYIYTTVCSPVEAKWRLFLKPMYKWWKKGYSIRLCILLYYLHYYYTIYTLDKWFVAVGGTF